jgi:hypothetical protein
VTILPNQKLITDPVKAADMFCISSKSHRGGNDFRCPRFVPGKAAHIPAIWKR